MINTRTAASPTPGSSADRAFDLIGCKWTLPVLRQLVLNRTTRFNDLVTATGIVPSVLSSRLKELINAGVVTQRQYRDGSSRPRLSYHPTAAGENLRPVLQALEHWGEQLEITAATTAVQGATSP